MCVCVCGKSAVDGGGCVVIHFNGLSKSLLAYELKAKHLFDFMNVRKQFKSPFTLSDFIVAEHKIFIQSLLKLRSFLSKFTHSLLNLFLLSLTSTSVEVTCYSKVEEGEGERLSIDLV